MPLYLLPPLHHIQVANGGASTLLPALWAAEVPSSHNLYPLPVNAMKCHTDHHVELLLTYGVI